jgi:hypothetical protein
MNAWLPAMMLAVLPVVGLGAVQALDTPPGAPVAVIFSPSLSADDAMLRVAAAGGELLGPGGWPSVVIARADRPDFISAAYAQGALLVTSALSAGPCSARAARRQRIS